jgi:hypothetical protein
MRENETLSGIVINLSEKGMFIKADSLLPGDADLDLRIPFHGENITLPAHVVRQDMMFDSCDSFGVELPHQSSEYLEIVESSRKKPHSAPILMVSEVVLKETTQCQTGFQCLSSVGKDLCPVEKPKRGSILLIKKKVYTSCPYMISFGISSHICKCPTRKDIFSRYNI